MNAIVLPINIILVGTLLFVPLTHAEELINLPEQENVGGIPMLDKKLERNYNAITDIPGTVSDSIGILLPPPPRLNPAHTTWIGIRVHTHIYEPESDRPALITYEGTSVSFLNPGNNTAEVGCIFFNNNGNILVDKGIKQRLGRGEKGGCGLSVERNESLLGWVLVTSDYPILPEGYHTTRIYSDSESAIKLYPIDCTDPTGVEFVCSFVNN